MKLLSCILYSIFFVAEIQCGILLHKYKERCEHSRKNGGKIMPDPIYNAGSLSAKFRSYNSGFDPTKIPNVKYGDYLPIYDICETIYHILVPNQPFPEIFQTPLRAFDATNFTLLESGWSCLIDYYLRIYLIPNPLQNGKYFSYISDTFVETNQIEVEDYFTTSRGKLVPYEFRSSPQERQYLNLKNVKKCQTQKSVKIPCHPPRDAMDSYTGTYTYGINTILNHYKLLKIKKKYYPDPPVYGNTITTLFDRYNSEWTSAHSSNEGISIRNKIQNICEKISNLLELDDDINTTMSIKVAKVANRPTCLLNSGWKCKLEYKWRVAKSWVEMSIMDIVPPTIYLIPVDNFRRFFVHFSAKFDVDDLFVRKMTYQNIRTTDLHDFIELRDVQSENGGIILPYHFEYWPWYASRPGATNLTTIPASGSYRNGGSAKNSNLEKIDNRKQAEKFDLSADGFSDSKKLDKNLLNGKSESIDCKIKTNLQNQSRNTENSINNDQFANVEIKNRENKSNSHQMFRSSSAKKLNISTDNLERKRSSDEKLDRTNDRPDSIEGKLLKTSSHNARKLYNAEELEKRRLLRTSSHNARKLDNNSEVELDKGQLFKAPFHGARKLDNSESKSNGEYRKEFPNRKINTSGRNSMETDNSEKVHSNNRTGPVECETKKNPVQIIHQKSNPGESPRSSKLNKFRSYGKSVMRILKMGSQRSSKSGRIDEGHLDSEPEYSGSNDRNQDPGKLTENIKKVGTTKLVTDHILDTKPKPNLRSDDREVKKNSLENFPACPNIREQRNAQNLNYVKTSESPRGRPVSSDTKNNKPIQNKNPFNNISNCDDSPQLVGRNNKINNNNDKNLILNSGEPKLKEKSRDNVKLKPNEISENQFKERRRHSSTSPNHKLDRGKENKNLFDENKLETNNPQSGHSLNPKKPTLRDPPHHKSKFPSMR